MYPAAEDDSSKEDQGQTSDDAETALLPKSLFGGECKVGDVYKVKVVAVHEDELEVEPAESKEKESSEGNDENDMENPVDRMQRGRMME